MKQIDQYDEKMLRDEREKLRDTDPFTVLEYIKSSVEILMNMKMDEQKTNVAAAKASKFNNGSDDDLISIGSSAQLDSKEDSKL